MKSLKGGNYFNEPGTYAVVLKRTGKVLEKFRNKVPAEKAKLKWGKMVFEEVEVRKIRKSNYPLRNQKI